MSASGAPVGILRLRQSQVIRNHRAKDVRHDQDQHNTEQELYKLDQRRTLQKVGSSTTTPRPLSIHNCLCRVKGNHHYIGPCLLSAASKLRVYVNGENVPHTMSIP